MSKPIGENAYQKTVRLLKKLNDELVEPGSDEQLTINQEPDGSCELVFDRFTILVGFDNQQELLEFLEASQLARLFKVKAWSAHNAAILAGKLHPTVTAQLFGQAKERG